MLRQLTFYFCIACVLLISACGDDGAFTEAGSSSSTTTGTTASVASLSLVTSNIQLSSDGSDSVTITATVKDSGNALLSGVNVSFSATSGDLTVTKATTDSSGQATATLSAGNDPTNRTISVTASANGNSDSLDIKRIWQSAQHRWPFIPGVWRHRRLDRPIEGFRR